MKIVEYYHLRLLLPHLATQDSLCLLMVLKFIDGNSIAKDGVQEITISHMLENMLEKNCLMAISGFNNLGRRQY